MRHLPRPPVLMDILEEHFQELDFLWEQREKVVFAPDWTLRKLAAHEERADAHLDGLLLAQGHVVEIVRPGLEGDQKSAAAAAAMTLISLGSSDLEEEVLAAMATASDEARDGIRIGLRHSDASRLTERLSRLASAGEPVLRASAADVMAFHRMTPLPRLADLLATSETKAQRLLYGAIGRFGGPWSIDVLEIALDGNDQTTQEAALEASARLGMPQLAQILRKAATRLQDPSQAALSFLGILGDPQDLDLLTASINSPVLARSAVEGLGALGQVAAIPRLIEAMDWPDLAQAAQSAFVRITGASGIESDHPLPAPDNSPEEDLDFLEPIIPADPAKARAWWNKEKHQFPEEGRWQAGLEVSASPLGDVFNRLPLRLRRDVYLGALARGLPQAPDLELEQRARDQLRRF